MGSPECERMIRPIQPADDEALIELTTATGYFKPIELSTLREVLSDYHKEDRLAGHRAFLWEEEGRLIGFVYYAPTPMTDRSWHLYWIAVAAGAQGRGFGGRLLEFVENDVRERGGRMLLIETSLLPHYESTRRFYFKYGYSAVAQIPDYYADGDGLIVFAKRTTPPEPVVAVVTEPHE
jgi:ribosomal protein S18 acetylase RimI-like enzyme